MTHTVTLIPGDGIGPEIGAAVQKVLAAAGAPVQWDLQPLNETILTETKGVPPAAVLDSIRHNRVALKGPLMTPVGPFPLRQRRHHRRPREYRGRVLGPGA